MDRYVLWKFASYSQKVVLHILQFRKKRVCCFPPMGQVEVITQIVSALWRASLILALNRSFIKTEQTCVNILKVLALTVSLWILHVKFLPEIPPNYS
jgi:hypothetical protein